MIRNRALTLTHPVCASNKRNSLHDLRMPETRCPCGRRTYPLQHVPQPQILDEQEGKQNSTHNKLACCSTALSFSLDAQTAALHYFLYLLQRDKHCNGVPPASSEVWRETRPQSPQAVFSGDGHKRLRNTAVQQVWLRCLILHS